MTRYDHRWDELQTRWAQGERLSAEEEQERLDYAEYDALARRELALFAELRARGAAPDQPVPPVLIGRALEAVRASPRLRLVPAHELAREVVPPPRRTRVAWLALGGLLLAGASLALLNAVRPFSWRAVTRPPPVARAPLTQQLVRAELVLAAGQVQVRGRAFSVGQGPLDEGASVTTEEGRACLTIDPGIDVCLGPKTTIRLESLAAASVRLRVGQGTALASLSRRAPGRTFSLVSADVSAVAHGTTYAVRQEGDSTDVVVVEGTVEVTRQRGRRELVEAHSRVVAPAQSTAFVKSAVGRSEEARLLALSSPRRLWSGAAVGVLELASAPSRPLQVIVDDEEPLPLPLQTFAGAGTHHIRWRDAAGAESTAWTELAAGETRQLAAPLPGSASPTPGIPSEKPSPTALLELARRELAHARPRQALVLYEQLRASYPASAEARTVLVTMGKLELDLGRFERSLGRFEAYLRDGGPLAPEALAGKARALRGLGRSQEERLVIQRYLAANPEGFEAPLFTKRLHELGGP